MGTETTVVEIMPGDPNGAPSFDDDDDGDDDNGDGDGCGSGGTAVACDNCGYVWCYSGERWVATCPNCDRRTDTGLKPDEFEDDDNDDE